MEQVQQKRGLRIVAAIMFIMLCVVEIISNVRYMANNTWMFSGSGAAKNIISQISGDLIYSIAILAMMAAGLFAGKKSNGLRFAFGGLFAALLLIEIACLIGEISFENAFRIYWSEFVMLIAAAAVLFAVKRISLVGVGFSMLAWIRLMRFIRYIDDDANPEYIIFALVILIAMALAAAVCFLNDSEKRRGAAIPLGIVAIVFVSIWYIYMAARSIDTLSHYTRTDIVLDVLISLFSTLFLFLGTLFAMIAIAFRKKTDPAKNIAYQSYQQPQPYQAYGQQPYRSAQPQYGQPYQQQWQPPQQPYQPVPPRPAQPWQPPQRPYQPAQQPYQPTQQPYQPAQQPYQPAQQPYQPAQQPYQSAQPQYQSAQPQYQTAQQQYRQPQQEPTREQAEQTAQGGDYRNLDFEQYAPLNAGVSMKPDKDYKFHRAEGFVGSMPQKFIDRTFIKCPICCSAEPNWTIAQHNQMSWKGNLYLFKCSHCNSVISMSMPDVTTLSNGGGGIAANPTVGLTNLMVKANSGKEVGAVYAVIESVGNSGVNPACQGKEFKLEQLQKMSLRA